MTHRVATTRSPSLRGVSVARTARSVLDGGATHKLTRVVHDPRGPLADRMAIHMTVRETVKRLLDRGPEVATPDDLVELVRVPGYLGPMTLASLQEQGFHATGTDAMNLATGVLSDFRIVVKRRELERASAALEKLL